MCDMSVESCMILVVCWLNQDHSWYSTDYQVYMGSSMTVQPLAGCYCTCDLINWTVLLQLASNLQLLMGAHALTLVEVRCVPQLVV